MPGFRKFKFGISKLSFNYDVGEPIKLDGPNPITQKPPPHKTHCNIVILHAGKRGAMMFVVHKMATASFISSSLFLPKPTSLPSIFLHLPLKRFVSLPTQFRQRYGLVSATSASAVDTPALTQNDSADLTRNQVESEKIVLPTNESSHHLLRIRHTVT